MIFWILAALLTALAVLPVVSPFFITDPECHSRKWVLILGFFIPFLSLGLYFLCGSATLDK